MKKIISFILCCCMLAVTMPANAKTEYMYYTQDFETNSLYGYTPVPKTDSATGLINSVNIESGYLKLNKTFTSNDCHVDFDMGKTANNIVIETDFKSDDFGTNMQLFFLRDSSVIGNLDQTAINIDENGILKAGTKYIQLTKQSWYNITLLFDIQLKTFTVYLDDELLVSNAVLTQNSISEFSMLRYRLHGTGIGDLEIDNIKIYSGTQKRDITGETVTPITTSVFKTDSYAISCLQNKNAVHGYSGYMFANGSKQKMSVNPVNIDDEIYVSISDAELILEESIVIAGNDIIISNIILAQDSLTAFTGEEKVFVDYAPKNINGVLMIPLGETASLLGQCVYNDQHGMILVSKASFEISRSSAAEANGYLFHERPKANQIADLYNQNSISHPRVLITGNDFERIRTSTDTTLISWRQSAIEQADALLNTPANTYEIPDGLRLLGVSTSVVSRITTLGFAYQMTNNTEYSNRAWVEIDAVCNFPDWNAYAHFLDAAEMSFALAVCYDWMYDRLSPEQKDKMVNALKAFGTGEAEKVYTKQFAGGSNFWATSNINWNAVCNGGIGIAAMAFFEEDPTYFAFILENAIRGLEYSWHEIAPDGAWDEGVGYWGYFLKYAVRFLSTAETTLGTDFRFLSYKSADKFGYFQAYMSSPLGAYNFHDAGQSHESMPSLWWLSNKYGNPDFGAIRFFSLSNYQSFSIEDILWYNSQCTQLSNDLSNDIYYRDVEAVSMREHWFCQNGMSFFCHGGKTSGGHNHFDAGSFIYEVNGVRWAIDLGSEDYNISSKYGGKQNIYRVRTEGHNTLLMNPSADAGQDADGFAKVIRYESGDGESLSVLDLSSDYKQQANSAIRSFYSGDKKRSLTIRDELDLKSETTIYWFMHTKASMVKRGSKEIQLVENGKKLNFAFDTNVSNAELKIMDSLPLPGSPANDEQNKNEGIKKIAIKMTATGQVNLAVKLSPADEGISAVPSKTTISDLTVMSKLQSFDAGSYCGLYGRDTNDFSLYAQNYTIETDCKKKDMRCKVGFYIALGEASPSITAKGYLGGSINEEDLGNFLEFRNDGSLYLLGKEIIPKGKKFIKNKWYKFNAIFDNDTVTAFIDNVRVVENLDIDLYDKLRLITSFMFNNVYIDDFSFTQFTKNSIPCVSLIHTQWDYDKFLNIGKGIYTYAENDINKDSLAMLGTVNIRKAVALNNDYIILKTADNEKIYAPILYSSTVVYSGNSNIVSFENEPFAYEPLTIKVNLLALSGNSASVKVLDQYYNFAEFKADGFVYVNGQKTDTPWIENVYTEVAVTVYPGKTAWDVYINGNARLKNQIVFSQNADYISEVIVNGVQNGVLCYTGGYYRNISE